MKRHQSFIHLAGTKNLLASQYERVIAQNVKSSSVPESGGLSGVPPSDNFCSARLHALSAAGHRRQPVLRLGPLPVRGPTVAGSLFISTVQRRTRRHALCYGGAEDACYLSIPVQRQLSLIPATAQRGSMKFDIKNG